MLRFLYNNANNATRGHARVPGNLRRAFHVALARAPCTGSGALLRPMRIAWHGVVGGLSVPVPLLIVCSVYVRATCGSSVMLCAADMLLKNTPP
jgi:hypothetical protein